MKFTLSWLKEYLDTDATLEEICDKLTFIGLEVEEVEDRSRNLRPFKAVEVLNVVPHPDSNHLNICQIKTAESELLQVICGAPNVRAGMKSIFASAGTIIPLNKMEVKKAKIRGIESYGMLCSERELGLGEEHERGIIDLPKNTELGKSVVSVYGIDDPIIEINVTPNRGDCLGVYGVARDLAASGIGKLKQLPEFTENIQTSFMSPISIRTKDRDLCPIFLGRYIKGVKNCPSPKWMQNRLKAVGARPISALVDITNYVMFCLSRPMHCYDADKIVGNITVRRAGDGEDFRSLNEIDYRLDKDSLVITDDEKILGLGGIIGGINSGSLPETQNVLLESAVFDAINIARTGRKFNINSDARYRFERGVDAELTQVGLDMATSLILEICGGESSAIISEDYSKRDIRTVQFNTDRVKSLLGIDIAHKEIIKILKSLKFKTSNEKGKEVKVEIPSWRHDISIAEDLVEEVARIYGYNNVPTINISKDKVSKDEDTIFDAWEIRKLFAGRGMNEVITWAFMNNEIAELFTQCNEKLQLLNPISSDLNYMRPSIIPNLISAYIKNEARGYGNISFFEIGTIFLGINPEDQKKCIAGIRIGKAVEKNIYSNSRNFDIFDVKKDVLDCLTALGIPLDSLKISREDIPKYYHSQRSGTLKLGKNILAYFGEIHPGTCKSMDIKDRINAFEILLDNLPTKKTKKSTARKPFLASDLQPLTRDFAFIVDKNVAVGEIINLAKIADKNLVQAVNIFDVYEGEGISADKKSVAFSITIQPIEKTLTSEDIEILSDKIIGVISEKLGGILRDK